MEEVRARQMALVGPREEAVRAEEAIPWTMWVQEKLMMLEAIVVLVAIAAKLAVATPPWKWRHAGFLSSSCLGVVQKEEYSRKHHMGKEARKEGMRG